jgi:hypothetical protein
VSVALAAGCQTSTTPASILDRGTRTVHTLREEPHRAAACVARNLDRHSSGYDARIREGVEPVLVEVHVSAQQLVALAQFLIAGEGSTAVIRTMPDLRDVRDAMVAAMIEGC